MSIIFIDNSMINTHVVQDVEVAVTNRNCKLKILATLRRWPSYDPTYGQCCSSSSALGVKGKEQFIIMLDAGGEEARAPTGPQIMESVVLIQICNPEVLFVNSSVQKLAGTSQ